MIALDTNILVRLLTEDDPQQADASTRLIAHGTAHGGCFISVVVLCELAWTLRRFYGFPEERIREAVIRLTQVPGLEVGNAASVAAALASPGDLSDALIHELGREAGCRETVTFDRRFARLPGVRLLAS